MKLLIAKMSVFILYLLFALIVSCKAPEISSKSSEELFETVVVEFNVNNTPRTVNEEFILKENGWYVIGFAWNVDGPFSNPNIGIPRDLVGAIQILNTDNEIIVERNLELPSILSANGTDILTFKSKKLGVPLNVPLTLKLKDTYLSDVESNIGTITVRLFKTGYDRI